jgi:hypothetical protein
MSSSFLLSWCWGWNPGPLHMLGKHSLWADPSPSLYLAFISRADCFPFEMFLLSFFFPSLEKICSIFIRWTRKLGTGAHACNPSYSEGRDQENHDPKPARTNSSWDPILKKKITKKGCWSGSGCRPWVQIQVCKKKKKDEHENKATALWLIKHENNLGFRG